jgi:nucleolar complex protein 2
MLKQLDMESIVRAPNDYVKTRVYNEGLAEECVWILGEWLSSDVVHGSVGFPELVVPVTVSLRKMLKTSASSKGKGKSAALVKGLVERIEEASVWVANLRRDAKFGPKQGDELAAWEATLRDKLTKKGKTESPLLAWLRVKRKERGKRREMLDKAREGKGEIVGEEGDLSS